MFLDDVLYTVVREYYILIGCGNLANHHFHLVSRGAIGNTVVVHDGSNAGIIVIDAADG